MTTITSWQDGAVFLPVPLRYVSQVAEYASNLAAGRATPSSTQVDPEDSVMVPGQGAWTQDMMGRLAANLPYDGVIALLDSCAQRPSQWILKSDIETAGGFSAIQLRNELGAFSKRTRKLFGEVTWPVEYKKERGFYSYRLDPTLATWWTTARKDLQR